MLNKTMKRREILTLILTVLVVIWLYRCITNSVYNSFSPIQPEIVNNKQISSQQLFDNSWKIIKDKYVDTDLNSQKWSYWKKHYKGKIKTDEDAKVAIDTILSSLNDPYSRFLTKKEFEEQGNSINAEITGIGITMTQDNGKTIVYSVIEGTPAQKAGLKANDIITEVDDKNVSAMELSDVATLIRGKKDTVVKLKIKRGKTFLTKRIKRERIEIKSVETSITKQNYGYIKIKSFISTNTSKEFVKALAKTSKTKGLIIDLRGNTGGLVTNAVAIANLYITKGNLVSIVYRNGKKYDVTAQEITPAITKPTVVLIDETSASASEILSGALKDYKKATLIGSKTFGKGLIQQIIPMENGTGLDITIAKYLTPKGYDINKKGVQPDIVVPYSLSQRLSHDDVQLKKAETILNNLCK